MPPLLALAPASQPQTGLYPPAQQADPDIQTGRPASNVNATPYGIGNTPLTRSNNGNDADRIPTWNATQPPRPEEPGAASRPGNSIDDANGNHVRDRWDDSGAHIRDSWNDRNGMRAHEMWDTDGTHVRDAWNEKTGQHARDTWASNGAHVRDGWDEQGNHLQEVWSAQGQYLRNAWNELTARVQDMLKRKHDGEDNPASNRNKPGDPAPGSPIDVQTQPGTGQGDADSRQPGAGDRHAPPADTTTSDWRPVGDGRYGRGAGPAGRVAGRGDDGDGDDDAAGPTGGDGDGAAGPTGDDGGGSAGPTGGDGGGSAGPTGGGDGGSADPTGGDGGGDGGSAGPTGGAGNARPRRNTGPSGNTAAPDPEMRGAASQFSQAQLNRLNSASHNLIHILDRALDRLDKYGANDPELKQWFGANANPDQIRQTLMKMRQTLASGDYKFALDPPAPGNWEMAHVFPNDRSHTIHVRPHMLDPVFGKNTPEITLAHELSHFDDIGGTRDHIYGDRNALTLARTNSATAMNNAENYGMFIRQVTSA
ncbi:M35 family metallo-endopeptidase [Paraburkholderia solisilvae]|nr:M35 family metallo-endopeptidase [Paraburkholderia solisilvae]